MIRVLAVESALYAMAILSPDELACYSDRAPRYKSEKRFNPTEQLRSRDTRF